MYDVDGNDYIDYVAGFGPMILGYAPEPVNAAVREQLEKGYPVFYSDRRPLQTG